MRNPKIGQRLLCIEGCSWKDFIGEVISIENWKLLKNQNRI